MYSIGTIREFRTKHFSVIVDAIDEDYPDLSWDETGETQDKIESGEYILFCARARVIHVDLGEIGSDYLGNCVYESLESFEDHRECAAYTRELRKSGNNAVCGSYFADMVAESIRQARETLRNAHNIYVRG